LRSAWLISPRPAVPGKGIAPSRLSRFGAAAPRAATRNRSPATSTAPGGAPGVSQRFSSACLAGVGLRRSRRLVDIDAELSGIDRGRARVFGVDEGADGRPFFCPSANGGCSASRGPLPEDSGPVNFPTHPAARQRPPTPSAMSSPEGEPEENGLDGPSERVVFLPSFIHRALAELALDLGKRRGGTGPWSCPWRNPSTIRRGQWVGGAAIGWCSLWRGICAIASGTKTGGNTDQLLCLSYTGI